MPKELGLEELRVLSEKATPGEWAARGGTDIGALGLRGTLAMTSPQGDGNGLNDRAFIVACVNYVREHVLPLSGMGKGMGASPQAGSGSHASHSTPSGSRRPGFDPSREQSVWLPGEIAPKDGTWFWGWIADAPRRLRWCSAEAIAAEEGGEPEDYQEGFYDKDDDEWAPTWWTHLSNFVEPPPALGTLAEGRDGEAGSGHSPSGPADLSATPTLPLPPRVRCQGWEPIETAPKDGKHLLVCWADLFTNDLVSAVEVAKFSCGSWCRPDDSEDTFTVPTHWMPLPASPTPTEG